MLCREEECEEFILELLKAMNHPCKHCKTIVQSADCTFS